MADYVQRFNIRLVGGCCGTTADHIEQLVRRLKELEQKRWIAAPRIDRAASAIRSVDLRQEPPPLLVGERMNASGSRKFKELLMQEDFDAILQLARDQIAGGAHLLDLNTAHNDLPKEECYYMSELIRRLAPLVESPLMIDSNDPLIHETALALYPGRAVINSVNLEGDGSRLHSILEAARRWGAAVVAMTIDEEGMALDGEKKFAIAEKIYRIAVEDYGFSPGSLIFDPLTFPLTTGETHLKDSAKETLQAIHQIKERLPAAKTNLGISNVSFGIGRPARKILNSIFLYHAIQAGLDMAIVNPKDITPYPEIPEKEKTLAEDLIFNRAGDALARLADHFEKKKGVSGPARTPVETELPIDKRIENHILRRLHDRLDEDLEEALKSYSPAKIINEMLIKAMKEVGDRFGKGELILPYVLESAGVMKKAMTYLEPFMEQKAVGEEGKIVLATVYGDVHDIGKNLVKTILTHNGFNVIDLGTQVPVQQILDRALKEEADAIGLSALLVSTSQQMKHMVKELDRRGLGLPLLVGGAAVNRRFCEEISRTGDGQTYAGGVFYCRDAFEGIQTLNEIQQRKSDGRQLTEEKESRGRGQARPDTKDAAELRTRAADAPPRRSPDIKIHDPLPVPAFWGAWRPDDLMLKNLFPRLNLDRLYRHYWKGKSSLKMDYASLVREIYEPKRMELQKQCLDLAWIVPKGVYGFFPCRAEGQTLNVYSPNDFETVMESFHFPRQKDKRFLCLADYFAPGGSEKPDVLGLFTVTAGHEVLKIIEDLNQEGKFDEAFYLQGLAMSACEAGAGWLHSRMRRELNLEARQGKRYSFGFPICPDLADQAKLFRLLQVTYHIGVRLTASFQMDPELSISALVVHHPDATYFNL